MATARLSINRFWFPLASVLFVLPAYGASPAGRDIAPPDVFAHVAVVHGEIELIRREMGKPKMRRPEIAVKHAAPREVFFQALTLYRKADQLCLELTGQQATVPAVPSERIRPSHVYLVVNAALERLQIIKKVLGIAETSVKPERRDDKTPTDVFRSIVQANRQLNIMLVRKFSPSDVYGQITQAISYASLILSRFAEVPEQMRVPRASPFERYKVPSDVYRRLIKCFEIIRDIAQRSGLAILSEGESEENFMDVAPGDVYNLASLIVSELAYLNRLLGNNQPVRSYYPGLKFPSHVYQRVSILERQLDEILAQVKRHPRWLANR
ncbi:MAG: hypothetical protein ACE5G9_11515 [Nitrospinales bacterium]